MRLKRTGRTTMNSEAEELVESFNLLFEPEDLVGMWPAIKSAYETFGFTDKISDRDKIDEYKYINTQLRKYIGSNEAKLKKNVGNWIAVSKDVQDIVAKIEDKNDDRKSIVYSYLRNSWLTQVYVLVETIVEVMEE